MVKKKDMAKYLQKKGVILKDNLKIILWMVKGPIDGIMAKYIKDNG